MRSYKQFLAELKRRNVFKVAAVYGGTAFVLLQLADVLGEGLRLPESFLPFITAVILLGFPLALILAWAFEMTPQGMQRTNTATQDEIEEILAQPVSKRWPAGLLALAGVAALVAGAWWAGGKRAGATDASGETGAARADSLQLAFAEPDEDPRPAIAVLPFADMSPQTDQAYFSDGITEEILNTLAKVRELKVAARTSAFAFRGRELDMRAIGDSLDVGYLIEGSVRKAGDRLRITVQLIDADDGSHLWSESYDRRLDDVFAIQTEIARAIADELRVPLGLDDPSDLVTPTADLEAYDLYLAGRTMLRDRGESLGEAVRLFEAAIARDSGWAPAWAGLAEAHELRSWYPAAWDTVPSDPASFNALVLRHHEASERAARRAIALDPNIASARVALGSVLRNRREWEASEREYLRALAIDPDNGEAHQQYSEMLSNMGRIPEALVAARRAVQLDDAPIRRLTLAGILWADDRTEEAIEQTRRGILMDAEGAVPILRSTWYLRHMSMGDFEGALEFGYPDGMLANLTRPQHEQFVRAMRAGDPALLPPDYDRNWPLVAVTWQAYGDRALGLTAIDNTVALNPHGNLIFLQVPALDPLREEPRFRALLERLNLSDAPIRRTPRESAGTP